MSTSQQIGSAYTLADLKEKSVREFKTHPTKSWYRSGNGKLVREHVGVEYVTTFGAGVLPEDEWYQLMENAIERERKTGLLDAIIARCGSLAWLRTEKEIRRYAIDCLSGGSYERWEDFDYKEKSYG